MAHAQPEKPKASNEVPVSNKNEIPPGIELAATRHVDAHMANLKDFEHKDAFREIADNARAYVDHSLLLTDDRGREIYDNSAQTFAEISEQESASVEAQYAHSIERLNRFGFAPSTVGLIVSAEERTMYIVYKASDSSTRIIGSCKITIGSGPLGSNINDEANPTKGTPLGMLRLMMPSGKKSVSLEELRKRDNYPVGMSKNDPAAKIKPRGHSYLSSRWLRAQGLEQTNDQSDARSIMWHGSAVMDTVGAESKEFSSGCVIQSNADAIHIWGFLRENLFKGQGILCDVVRSARAPNT